MKHLILFLLVITIFSCKTDQKTSDSYYIDAKAPGVYNGMRAYLQISDESGRLKNSDTAIVIDEKFFFEGQRNEPTLEYLIIDGYKNSLPLIIENGKIDILIEKDSIHTSKVTGSQKTTELKGFYTKEIELTKKYRDLIATFNIAQQNRDSLEVRNLFETIQKSEKEILNLTIEHINNGHTDSYISVMMLEKIIRTNKIPLEDIEPAFNKLSTDIKASSYGKNIVEYIDTQKALQKQQGNTKIGAIAPNFSGKTPDNKTLSLNDIKGKVTIIDFWASWCGPCRRENPNVVKMYNKYHNEGLEIIGVSLDKSGQKNRWEKAIKDDKLNWHHVSNLQFWQDPIARMYGVRSIPATFILDASGKIVAKNLRGQDLENKVAELLK